MQTGLQTGGGGRGAAEPKEVNSGVATETPAKGGNPRGAIATPGKVCFTSVFCPDDLPGLPVKAKMNERIVRSILRVEILFFNIFLISYEVKGVLCPS